MKKYLIVLLMLVLVFAGCSNASVNENQDSNVGVEIKEDSANADNVNEEVEKESTKVKFVDDSGNEIVLEKPVERIISLYSVHTENIFALGAGDKLIGVGMSAKYPDEALEKKKFSYKDDPEIIIAENPDVVIARTSLIKRYPDYFDALKDSGIVVVNLYCSKFENFDSYITRLGMLVGKNDEAKNYLENFYKKVEIIKANASQIQNKKNAYFEAIGPKFRTATEGSFPITALELVGLNNIASGIEYNGTSTVVEFGEEKLLSKGNEIDVYIAQKGVMNRKVSVDEIKSRPGYDSIKAVKEGNIIIIDEKLISSSTLRYLDGLKFLQEQIYGAELNE